MARNPKKAAKKTVSKRKAKHGGKVVTKRDIAEAAAKTPDTIKLPPRGAVRKLVNDLANKKAEVRSHSGDMGEMVAEAAEKKNVDKKALSIVRGLDEMARKKSANALLKFATTFYHLIEYMKEMGFQEIADKQASLQLEQAAEAEEDAQDEDAQAEQTDAEELPGAEGQKSPSLKLVDPSTEEAAA